MQNTHRISRPFATSFDTALKGETVSYSDRANKIAIGLDAVKVSKADMAQLLQTSYATGERFRLAIELWERNAY